MESLQRLKDTQGLTEKEKVRERREKSQCARKNDHVLVVE